MRSRPAHYLLTALPFMTVFAAQEVLISTRVEKDGTGLRWVEIRADKNRRDIIDQGLDEILPLHRETRSRTGISGESYWTKREARFTDPTMFGDLKITRRTQLGVWPPFRTQYTYRDTLVRTAFTGTDRETGAAAKTQYQYVVTMPGTIDADSVTPHLGHITGNTVTWDLKTDSERQEVAVSSVHTEWAPLILLLALILLGLLTGVRYLQYRQRTKPQKI
ncbi:MAG: hypothetical protein ACUVX8_02090 [Candidatus Zipacnadales bacterium]